MAILLSLLFVTVAHAAEPMACPEIWQPVCGAEQVQCFAAPCYPIYKTYSNSCFLSADNAQLIHEGECTASESGPYKDGKETGGGSSGNSGTYVPPANCIAWFDGCNSCSRMSSGATACTLRACVGDPAPGYCTAYAQGNPQKPVATTTPADATETPATTTVHVGPHIGFFANIWSAIAQWFTSLF